MTVTSRYTDLYKGILWLGGLSLIALPLVIATQPASYTDGLLLSTVLMSSFFIVMSLVSWLGVQVRRRNEMNVGHAFIMRTSLRQAFIAGVTTLVLLILQLLRVISLVDAGLVALLALVIELYVGSRKVVA